MNCTTVVLFNRLKPPTSFTNYRYFSHDKVDLALDMTAFSVVQTPIEKGLSNKILFFLDQFS